MKAPSPTVFRLSDLPEEREISLTSEFIAEALAGLPGQESIEAEAGEPVAPGQATAHVTVSQEIGSVLARGTLRGHVNVACSRCLATVRLDIDEPFVTTFLPHATHADAETEVELNEDDLDVATYQGEELDVAPILHDHLVLAVPYAPLCREQCQGLCPRCGADLNQGPCDCPPPEVDPRLAALKNIKLS